MAKADSVRQMLRQGNQLYSGGQYTEAINKYNEALVEQPQAPEPTFNKANGYYRVDDLAEAIDLFQEVATKSKDMSLVARAKYNLGNCFFQRGAKQRDADLQKALEDMKTSISCWRQVLDIDPQNEKAARNIEVARLTIKDILDQLKQQKDQQQQQDQQKQQQQDQQGAQPKQDPNQPQDPNQAKDAEQKPDPNQAQPRQEPDQTQRDKQPEPQAQEQKVEPDATAQEIIDNEQRQKKERDNLQRVRYQDVEKDW
jgi:Ca-activated chloride channel family protein